MGPMDNSPSDSDHQELMQRHRNRKEVEWVPFTQRRSASGCDVQWEEFVATFTLEVPGLGALRVATSVNLQDPKGRMVPETIALLPPDGE